MDRNSFPKRKRVYCLEEAVQNENRKTSRDGLDEYIRVSSPGPMIVIGAMSLVLVATVVWGFTGTLPVTLGVTGCVVDSEIASEAQKHFGDSADDEKQKAWVVCFVDSSTYSADQITKFSKDVTIGMPDHTTFKGKVKYISSHPLSRDEAHEFLQDGQWIADQCVSSDYSWGVVIQVDDDVSGHIFTTPQVTFITDEVPPIRFLMR